MIGGDFTLTEVYVIRVRGEGEVLCVGVCEGECE